MENENFLLIAFLCFFGIIFIIVVIFGVAQWLNDFSRELKYLNSEIGRTRGAERKYWKRKKRRLFLSVLPFVKY